MNKEVDLRALTNSAIAVMHAFLEDKAIQFYSHAQDKWVDTTTPVWDFVNYKYRVKPKVKPFASVPEFCKVWDVEPLTYKGNGTSKYDVVELSSNGALLSPGGFFHWYHLAEKFTFSDGTPCGKKVEE